MFYFFFLTLLLSSFWTSRGHRCRSFPPGCCLQFSVRIGFSNPTARRFVIECCELPLSRFPKDNLRTITSPYEYIRECTGGLELTKLVTYTRLEDNLIRHRGDRLSAILANQVYHSFINSSMYNEIHLLYSTSRSKSGFQHVLVSIRKPKMEVSAPSQAYLTRGTGKSCPLFS